MPTYTFASHAADDRTGTPEMEMFLNRLRKKLRSLLGKKGAAQMQELIFEDHKSIQMGGEWQEALMAELPTTSSFLFFVSPTFESSEWCGRELSVALTRHGEWKKKKDRNQKSRFIFPIKWEINLQRRLEHDLDPAADLPDVIAAFQYRPPNSPATAAYTKHGLGTMMQLQRYQDDVTEFLGQLAQALVSGMHFDELPPHPEISDFGDVPLPLGWTGAPIPFEVNYHASAPNGLGWQPQAGVAKVGFAIANLASLNEITARPLPADAKGLGGRLAAAVQASQVFLVVADEQTPPDAVLFHLDHLPGKTHIALVLVSAAGPGQLPDVAGWLAGHGLHGQFAEAVKAGTTVAASASTYPAEIEKMLQTARGAAIRSVRGAEVVDAAAVAEANKKGFAVAIRPTVTGPGKSQP